MARNRAGALILALPIFCLGAVPLARIENHAGNISIRTERREKVEVVSRARRGPEGADRVRMLERADEVSIMVAAGDPIDLEVRAPYGWEIVAETREGSIDFAGLAFQARLATSSGSIRVAAPLEMTVFTVRTENKPRTFTHRGVSRGAEKKSAAGWFWTGWASPQGNARPICCEIGIGGGRPNRIDLMDMPVPPDSPVKPPSMAKAILDGLLEGGGMIRKRAGSGAPAAESTAPLAAELNDAPRFTANVRLVNLSIAAHDRDGRPVTGLTQDDFEISEDGIRQDVALVRSGETGFNLAVLVDVNGTTTDARSTIAEAARQFSGVVRSQDRLSTYALVWELFFVYSNQPGAMPFIHPLDGSWSFQAPLYNAIVLGCAEDLLTRSEPRNALIVITDGLDTSGQDPSNRLWVDFDRLRTAAAEMPILIYPVLLESKRARTGPEPTPRQKMEALAKASGGKTFDAEGGDLSQAAAQVGEELRSVYTVAYYPKNQSFDGEWREIQVRIKRPGVAFRTRPGYYAR